MAELYIYNSLTKQKERFEPIKPNTIKMYVCGMTVYDYCHIGHGRSMVTFDVVVRFLRAIGYAVTYVRNITDIDDKIIKRAHELNEDTVQLTARFIKALQEDEHALHILPPDFTPKATDYIPQIIAMVETLLEKKSAYIGANGDIYYDVAKFTTYGELAHQDLDKLQAGARIDINEAKHNPLDFVLWKLAKVNEPAWNSPWGKGRPGWHIECSAMSGALLGEHFDIHGGGVDLKFPHHQNEIAQSEAAHACRFVNIWMHNGHVQIDNEKMSKSLGNFFTIREVLASYHPEVVRYLLLMSHYRSPINYSTENLQIAKQALERLYGCLRDLPVAEPVVNSEFEQRFNAAMLDDFNTPVALAVLFDLVREINRLRAENQLTAAAELGAVLKCIANTILGILYETPAVFLQGGGQAKVDVDTINALIAKREVARANKNWQEADNIRNELLQMQIEIEDTPAGTRWKNL